MRISADMPGPWQVYRDGELQKNVSWVDTESAQWCAFTNQLVGWSIEEVHQAKAITASGWRIDIWTRTAPPQVPFEVHNVRKVDADLAMDAVRAMSRDYRSAK